MMPFLHVLAFIPALAFAAPACEGETNPFDTGLQACLSGKLAQKLKKTTAGLEAEKCESCLVSDAGAPGMNLAEICADPEAYVCKETNGLMFDSQCNLDLVDAVTAGKTAGFAATNCEFTKWKDAFLASRRTSCGSQIPPDQCENMTLVQNHAEILKKERLFYYTPERLNRLKRIFDRLQAEYGKLIRESTLIPDASKQHLIDLIKNTELHTSIEGPAPSCMNSEPTGVETEMYNRGGHEVIICLGAMLGLDHMNDYDIYTMLGHELAHSIDPCTLESRHLAPEDTFSISSIYPGLLECLRGGSGPGGCKDGVLHCNSDHGAEDEAMETLNVLKNYDDEVKKMSPQQLQVELQRLVAFNRKRPDCPFGKSDPTYHPEDAADFRKAQDPVDQSEESFADNAGAEIAGRIAAADAKAGKLDARGRADALISVAATFAQLHGGCRKENTNDPHPTGYLRVDRLIMGSERFRQGMGCPANTPGTPVKMSCHAL